MSQHEDDFSGCSTSSMFPSPAHSDAAFVHFSKGAHLGWFSSTFMYKLKISCRCFCHMGFSSVH